MSDDRQPRKITLNLSLRAQVALERILEATGESMTDAINNALRLYAVTAAAPEGTEFYLKKPHHPHERIHLP